MNKSELTKISWAKLGSYAHIRCVTSSNIYLFDGFKRSDRNLLEDLLKPLEITLDNDPVDPKGINWGELNFEGPEDHQHVVFMDNNNDRILEFPIEDVIQCQKPSKNEVEIHFMDNDNVKDNQEIIESIQFYFPPGADSSSTVTAAMTFRDMLMSKTDHDSDKANLIIRLDSSLGDFLVPRGHYSIEMYDKYMKLSGPTYTHKVPYSTIDNVYLLPMSDDVHSAVILCLNRPQKQGNQNIRFLILQTSFEESTIEFELEEQEMESRYHGKLHKEENGQMYRLVAKLFKYVAGKALYKESKFRNSNGKPYTKAVYRSQTGYIYLLEKCLFFIHKPTECILYEDIESLEFARYTRDAHQGVTTFDLKIYLRNKSSPIVFYTIQNAEFSSMFDYLRNKGLRILHLNVLLSDPNKMFDDDSDDSSFSGDEEMNEEDGEFKATKDDNEEDLDDSDIVDEDEDLAAIISENNHEPIDEQNEEEDAQLKNPKKKKTSDEDDEDVAIDQM